MPSTQLVFQWGLQNLIFHLLWTASFICTQKTVTKTTFETLSTYYEFNTSGNAVLLLWGSMGDNPTLCWDKLCQKPQSGPLPLFQLEGFEKTKQENNHFLQYDGPSFGADTQKSDYFTWKTTTPYSLMYRLASYTTIMVTHHMTMVWFYVVFWNLGEYTSKNSTILHGY